MKVLVIGGGGREHALVWKIAQSAKVKKIFCAPGNAGIAKIAQCVPISASDVEALAAFASKEGMDFTVVGPEAPLTEGLVDRFAALGLKVFGASKAAARLEGSKSFAKSLMEKYDIPTAKGRSFTSFKAACDYINKMQAPLVVKADGLAAGKGVIVCATREEAVAALESVMVKKEFGEAGKKALVEEFLVGEEASFLAFTDGKTVLPLPTSQDHKAVYDNDKGPNTGGMGAYSPAPVVDSFLHEKIMNTVMIPTVRAMAAEGCPYKGVLYAGLMISGDSVKVLEFNARFGDPEAQPLLMRLKTDLVSVMEAVAEERLSGISLEIDPRPCVCVVMASGGYPGKYAKGEAISGLDAASRMKDVVVFHAGTEEKKGRIVTSGGRVLGVTALGETIEKAIASAYKAVAKIMWNGAYHRTDIGQKAIRRLNAPPQVLIVCGSESDVPVMRETSRVLARFGITHELTIASAHRTPDLAQSLAKNARARGLKVIIAGAGAAAHLAGAFAAHTTLPVIGVPINATPLNGLDALLSTVQMPPGVPVACVAVGGMGARNAAYLAAQILAVADPGMEKKLEQAREETAQAICSAAEKLKNRA